MTIINLDCGIPKFFEQVYNHVEGEGGDGDAGVVVPSRQTIIVADWFEFWLKDKDVWEQWQRKKLEEKLTIFTRGMESILFSEDLDRFCTFTEYRTGEQRDQSRIPVTTLFVMR
jgi:hypothetical protein